MKNIFKGLRLFTIIAFTFAFFTGCSNGSAVEDISDYDFYKELPLQQNKISFPQSMDGKECFLIYTNETGAPIEIADPRPSFNTNSYRIAIEENPLNTGVSSNDFPSKQRFMHFDLPELSQEYLQKINNSNARAVVSGYLKYNPYLSENDMKKGSEVYFYAQQSEIENNTRTDVYRKTKFTLKAENDRCRVWGISDTSLDYNFDDYTYESLANVIKDNYEAMTDIFGTTAIPDNYIVVSASKNTKLEILVYDINSDREDSSIMGFFNSTDMFLNASMKNNVGNQCEIIHIDSYFLNKEYKKQLSTLIHEFQHLLNFINKHNFNDFRTQIPSYKYEPWFTELLSLCSEEIFQEKLGLADEDSPKCRFVNDFKRTDYGFLSHWYDNKYTYTYANAYAFGTYLMRNYGGVKLIHDIATNKYVNSAAITAALQKNNYKESFLTVLRKFPLVNIFTEAYENYDFTLNKDVYTSYKDYDFYLNAINLNDYPFYAIYEPDYNEVNHFYIKDLESNLEIDYENYNNNGVKKLIIKGPLIFKPNAYWNPEYNSKYKNAPIEPYGFLIYHLGQIDSSRTYTIYNSTDLKIALVVK